MIFSSFRSDFFELKIKKKTKIQNSKTISIFDANFNTLDMLYSVPYIPYSIEILDICTQLNYHMRAIISWS